MGTSRAYALENIDRSMAASVTAQLLDCKPMKKCCEFQYSYMKGDVVHREPGVVRMRFCSYREDARYQTQPENGYAMLSRNYASAFSRQTSC